MAGGNRAFTLQDILGQLNQDSGATSSDVPYEVNVLVVDSEALGFNDSTTVATGATSFKWDAAGAYWGTLPWQ
jgi:hypothetical protein